MKVWTLHHGEYDYRRLIGVFGTRNALLSAIGATRPVDDLGYIYASGTEWEIGEQTLITDQVSESVVLNRIAEIIDEAYEDANYMPAPWVDDGRPRMTTTHLLVEVLGHADPPDA